MFNLGLCHKFVLVGAWWASPNNVGNNNANVRNVNTTGDNNNVADTNGLRFSVLLKPGTIVVSGNGTTLNPYVVKYN